MTGDRITAIGRPGELTPGRRTQVADLGGLALAPGFIDIHTHYDAQVLWDGDLTPSCWHGVTSVIMGNCGFGVAPTRPAHRETVVRTLENVEGMSMEALSAGIDWCFETFPQYLAALEQRGKRLNVGAFLGHTPLRLFVLGGEERPATPEEIETHARPAARGARGRRDRLLDLAAAGPPGRVRPPGAEPVRRGGRGRRAGRRARRGRAGDLAGLHRARPVRQPVLRAGGAPRDPGDLDRPGDPRGQARRGAAHGRARRRAARRGLPADRLPPDRHADQHDRPELRSPRSTSGRRCWRAPVAERAALYRDASWRDRARPATLAAWSHRWSKIDVEETGAHADVVGHSAGPAGRGNGAPRRST